MQSPRKPETEAQYQTFKKQKQSAGADLAAFNLAEETVVREFTHWLIIKNRFPYDNMTSVNDMLVPKRAFADYYTASNEEREEYHEIIKQLVAEDYYDALVENFPRSKSVTRHNHVHLVRWQYTDETGKNKSESWPR